MASLIPSRPAPQPPALGAGRLDRSLEQLTARCLAMPAAERMALIDAEIAGAIAESRWDHAVKWQRVLLRVKRSLAKAAR